MRFLLFLLACIYIPNLLSQRDTIHFILFSMNLKPEDCTKGAASLLIDSGKPPYTVQWSTGVQNVYFIENLNTGDYSVKITDGNNKDTTIHFKIEKIVCPVIPERFFSPNGDNYRDTWIIHGLEFYPDFDLYVFNKWGQRIHHQQGGIYSPWDGKFQGVPVVDATYYFILYLEKNKKETILKGDITILR